MLPWLHGFDSLIELTMDFGEIDAGWWPANLVELVWFDPSLGSFLMKGRQNGLFKPGMFKLFGVCWGSHKAEAPPVSCSVRGVTNVVEWLFVNCCLHIFEWLHCCT